MSRKLFWILALQVILFGFLTKVYAINGNNVFFTVDEGRDAIYARQIINYHEILTKGPQATLTGLYTGPLWYYFVSMGYALMNGNPVGAVLVLTLLNLSVTIVLMFILRKEIDGKIALITGFGLMIFWNFFTTSLWGFNPFALVALAIILILLLIKKKYGLAVIPVLLAFNAELAGAFALFFFYIATGFWATLTKKITWRRYSIYAFLIPLIGLSKIIFDFLRTPRNHTGDAGIKVVAGTNFHQMAIEFAKMISGSAIPQNAILGFFLIIAVVAAYLRLKKKNEFVKSFVYLTFVLIFTSYLFFGSNHGWSAWHTVYIPVATLVVILLMCYELKRFGKILIIVILALNIINFRNNYMDYLRPSPNPSLLYNQIKVLDWIYTHNENNGFNLYTYTNTYFDYTYQYLIGWYGLPKYGFYPCEYSNFPLSIKALYIPGSANYVSPQLGCDKFRFLIVDSDTNGNENKDWINGFRNETLLVEKTQIGNTWVEKRKVPDKIR